MCFVMISFYYVTHDCFSFDEPHVTHLFYVMVDLFLILCNISSPLSSHSPVDLHRRKGDYSNVALNLIRTDFVYHL